MSRRRALPSAPGLLDRLADGVGVLRRTLGSLPRTAALLLAGGVGLLALVVWLVSVSLPDRSAQTALEAAGGNTGEPQALPRGEQAERHAAALAHVQRFAQDRAASLYHDTPDFGKAELIRSVTLSLTDGVAGPRPPGAPVLWIDALEQYDFARVFVYHRSPLGLTFCISSQSGSFAATEALGERVMMPLGRSIGRYFIIDYAGSALPQPELMGSLADCLDRLDGSGDLVRLGPWGQCDGPTASLCARQ